MNGWWKIFVKSFINPLVCSKASNLQTDLAQARDELHAAREELAEKEELHQQWQQRGRRRGMAALLQEMEDLRASVTEKVYITLWKM